MWRVVLLVVAMGAVVAACSSGSSAGGSCCSIHIPQGASACLCADPEAGATLSTSKGICSITITMGATTTTITGGWQVDSCPGVTDASPE